MIQIETNRLLLREYDPSDLTATHSYAKQADILIYETWGPNTLEESEAFIQRAIDARLESPRTVFELCVTLKYSEIAIGGCGFRIKKDKPTRGDFGYIIHPDFWNKGYATEAAQGIINYMIKNHGIKELEATCDVMNVASQKVIEKCGLQLKEEINNNIYVKGRVRKTYLFEQILD